MSKISNNTNSGLSVFNIIETGALFVGGKRFKDIIQELISEDLLEQGEIEDLRNLLTYLNTTALNEPWIINNDNRNAVLKSLITAIETKLNFIDTTALSQSSVLNNDNRNSVLKTAIDNLIIKLQNIDTTGLTQSSVLTDDNRNSVLKTRIDGNDGSLTDLTNKTRYIQQSTVGNNSANPKTANILSINVNSNPSGIHKGDLSIQAGFNLIRMKNNSTTIQDINYNDNQMTILSPNGMISSDAHLNRMMATDKIEIGNLGVQSSAAINIGGKGAQINIGSIDTTEIGQTNTIITIGKRTITRNTETYHKGNQYIAEARFEDLPISTGITLANIYALLSGSAPSYVLGAFVSAAGGFNYSDILHMNLSNPLQKNKDITTSKGITLETLKIFDNSAISLGFPKISTYFVNGDIISTQVVGDNTTSVFSGKIKLENHNTLNPLNINWAFSQDDDNVNVVDIKGDEGVFIHQGASAVNQPLRIINSCGSGGIELKVGGSSTEPASRGRKQHAEGGLFLRQSNQLSCAITKQPPDESLFGFKRKTNNNNAKVDYRLLVSCNADEPANPLNNGAQQNHGIVVYNEAKHKAIDDAAIATATQPVYTEYTAIDEDNITTPSLTFLGNYSGPTANTLYKNADNRLFWNGVELATNLSAGSGGIEYYIPLASNVTNPAPNPTTIQATETYTSTLQRTIAQSVTAVGAGILMARYQTGIINKLSNPFVEGVQTIQQYLTWNQNNTVGQLYGQVWLQASASNGAVVYERTYTAGVTTGGYQVLNGTPIFAPQGLISFSFSTVQFTGINIDTFNNAQITIKCRLEGQNLITQNWTTLQTSAGTITYALDDQMNQTITFNESFTINQTSKTNAPSAYRMVLFLTSPPENGHITQTGAGSTGNDLISYRLVSGGATTASFRILLYDGETAKQTITHTNTPLLVPIELPISPPYQIEAFNNAQMGFDIYLFQPSGAVNANHIMTFFFNDGTISHIETTINEPPPPTPTLGSVMTAGNTASTSLNMNNQSIQNCNVLTAATVTPNAITGWNVKSLTAGSGITTVNNNGTWTITNTGIPITPTIEQVLTAGSAAGNQNLSGINTLTATTVTPTNITGWNVKQITAGSGGVVVSNDGLGTYTISNDTQPSGGYLSAEYDYPITASTPVSQKPTWYAQNWSRISDWTTNTAADVYMSANGKYMAVATRGINLNQVGIFYSTDYNLNYATSALTKNWRSIAGTTTGDAIWAIQGGTNENNVPWTREIWKSTNFGVSWTQQTSPPDFQNANPSRIRVSADGKYQLMNDGRTNGLGKLYRSTDYGVTWTSKNLTTVTGTVGSVAISSNGAVQYAEISGTSEGLLTDTGSGGIYRSEDYGVNFNRVNTTDPIWNISCDSTGRIVAATTNTGVITSRDYGQTWATLTIAGATAVSVCPAGNIIWIGCINQGSTAQLYYSEDYGQTFVVRNQNPQGSYISTSYLTIATNHDGSIIVGGGNDNLNRFRLQPPEVYGIYAGTGISISSPFGLGSYQISSTATNDYQLFASGSVYLPYLLNGSTTFEINWLATMGKIDLSLYDIKYELDIHWDSNTTAQAWALCFFEVGLNAQLPTAFTSSGIIHSSVTNWQNEINSGGGGANLYNSTYNNRFYCGYSAQQNTHALPAEPMFRHKTMLSGELSMKRRTAVQAGFNDTSINSRTIINKFNCDNYLENNYTGTGKWGIWANTTPDDTFQHIRVQGTALWNLSYGDAWTNFSGTNEAISQGVYNLLIRMRENATTNALSRAARVDYRIYRIKK